MYNFYKFTIIPLYCLYVAFIDPIVYSIGVRYLTCCEHVLRK